MNTIHIGGYSLDEWMRIMAIVDEIERYDARVVSIPTRYFARVTERIQHNDPLALSAALNMAAGTEGLGE